MARRTDPAQLDFFATLDHPPAPPAPRSAEIIVFPAERMTGAMRDLAGDMLALPPRNQAGKLDLEIFLLRRRFDQLGVPRGEIARHVEAFRTGVVCQMRKRLILSILASERDGAA